MPYVDKATRARLGNPHSRTSDAQNAGQLTYNLQQELLRFIEANGLKYQTLAECLGALEGAKIDLQERIIKPYEERKRIENNDVWPAHLLAKAAYTPALDRRCAEHVNCGCVMVSPDEATHARMGGATDNDLRRIFTTTDDEPTWRGPR